MMSAMTIGSGNCHGSGSSTVNNIGVVSAGNDSYNDEQSHLDNDNTYNHRAMWLITKVTVSALQQRNVPNMACLGLVCPERQTSKEV